MARITSILIADRKHGSNLCTLESHKAGIDYIRKHTSTEIDNVSIMFARDYWHTALGGPRNANQFEADGVSYRLTY